VGFRLLIGLRTEPGTVAFLLAFALTYLVRSLLWAGAGAVLVRVRAPTWSTRHSYWKMALFGPLLSALLASVVTCGFGHAADSKAYLREVSVPALAAETTVLRRDQAIVARASGEQAQLDSARQRAVFAAVLLGQGAAGLGLLRFVGSALLLISRLRSRTRIADARLLRRSERMRARFGSRQIPQEELETRRATLQCILPSCLLASSLLGRTYASRTLASASAISALRGGVSPSTETQRSSRAHQSTVRELCNASRSSESS
jgi:hypothetical protein